MLKFTMKCCVVVQIYFLNACQPLSEVKKGGLVERWGAHDAVKNRYLVGFCQEKKDKKLFSSFFEEESFFQNYVSDYLSSNLIKNVSYISSFELHGSKQFSYRQEKGTCGDHLLSQVEFYNSSDALGLLSKWYYAGRIDFWEPDWWNDLSQSPFDGEHLLYLREGRKWWTEQVKLPLALNEVKKRLEEDRITPQSPVIAVLDSGIDYEHPSLVGRVWENVDKKNTICPGGRWGCNTVNAKKGTLGDGEVHPYGSPSAGAYCDTYNAHVRSGDCMHGTHVAGILVGNVETGLPGVCPFCRVMNLRVLESSEGYGRISDSAVLRALKYLSLFERSRGKNLVRVVNLSFGKYHKGRALALYIEHLSNFRDGILVVAAAGNEDTQRRIYPAAHSSALAVAALSYSGRKASYSNYGSWVNIAAPGGEVREGSYLIESSIPGGGFSSSQGTSMATPVVAGAAGLLLSVRPEMTAKALRESLLLSSDNSIYGYDHANGYNYRNYFPQVDGEHVPLLGVGRLDVEALLHQVKRPNRMESKQGRTDIKCSCLIGLPQKSLDSRYFFYCLPILIGFVFFRIERDRKYEKSK